MALAIALLQPFAQAGFVGSDEHAAGDFVLSGEATDLPLRSSDARLRALFVNAVCRSGTFAALKERLARQRVIVYIEWSEALRPPLEAALLHVMSVAPDGTRLFRVVVRRGLPERPLIPVIAHELQHVFEAATNARSFERTFDALGSHSGGVYETVAAQEVQAKVREEIAQARAAKEASPLPTSCDSGIASSSHFLSHTGRCVDCRSMIDDVVSIGDRLHVLELVCEHRHGRFYRQKQRDRDA